jgi:hypothetical protein
VLEDRGLHALLVLGRQVFTRTDVSDSVLKKAVRAPKKESNPLCAAKRLAQWDANLSACVSVRGFVMDDHDRRSGLLRLVRGLEVFVPCVAALDASGVYDASALRVALGGVADRIKVDSTSVSVNPVHAGNSSPNSDSADPDPAASREVYLKACELFFDNSGSVPEQPVHTGNSPLDLDPAASREVYLKACELFFDGGASEGEGTSEDDSE